MKNTEKKQASVMGFARYRLTKGAKPDEFIMAARDWRTQFLSECEGILMHRVLGNLAGEFADAILATDSDCFDRMAEAHPKHTASGPVMKMLNPDSIRLTKTLISGTPLNVPAGFACIEFGTFSPKQGGTFTEDALATATAGVQQSYLSEFAASRAHFIGKVDDSTYSEVAFVEDTGWARQICGGYGADPACRKLTEMFDPESVDLDFWHVLA